MKFLVLALLICLGATAAAQTVTFRSGNHETFARLVIDIPRGRSWSLGRIGADYALDLGPGLAFDPDGAFARIPRDRLRDIEIDEDAGRLILRIACRCHASAFMFQPEKLVVDVTDGPPPPDSPWEVAIETTARQALAAIPLIGDVPPSTLLLSSPQAFLPIAGAAPDTVPQLDALAIDMARAVAAGILDPAGPVPALKQTVAEVAEAVAPTLPPLLPEVPAQPGVMFITADLLQRSAPGRREAGPRGEECRPESDLDLAAWAPTGDFATDIGILRTQVIDAASALNDEVLVALARAYLHFGFGAEAKQVLVLAEADSTTHRLLGHLADLIDGRTVVAGAWADQSGCLTATALWSSLAAGTIADKTQEERTAIETAFRVLPPGPRQAVAPRLAALFLAEGHTESAAAILERMPAQAAGTDEALTVQSDIVRDAASAAAARDVLLDAIRNGSRASAGTMIRLVDATLAAGLPVEPWMIETLAALRFEYGESPMGEMLAATELDALVAAGRFEEAGKLLSDPELVVGEVARSRHLTDLANALTEGGSDGEFLDFAFRMSEALPPGSATIAVAERLIRLGFPDIALELLAPSAEAALMGDRRTLRAAALAALGQGAEAALLLSGMNPANEAPTTATTAWRSGDWESMMLGEDPLLSAVAAGVLDDAPRPIANNSLADRQALIAASEETRRLAEALLDRFPPPEERASSTAVSQ